MFLAGIWAQSEVLLQVLRTHMMQHRWVEVWLAPFVLKPLSTLSVFGMTHLSTGQSCLRFPPAVPGGSGVVTLHSDTCAALWAGHGMAAEHSSWMGSSSSGARLAGCSAEQRSELVFP